MMRFMSPRSCRRMEKWSPGMSITSHSSHRSYQQAPCGTAAQQQAIPRMGVCVRWQRRMCGVVLQDEGGRRCSAVGSLPAVRESSM